jgi:Bax protein
MTMVIRVCQIVVLAVLFGLPISAWCGERIEFKGPQELEAIFEKANYTHETWNAGLREVPRYYVSHMPERWRKKYADEVPVKTKKRIFFRVIAPLVLRSNELILVDRKRLKTLMGASEKWDVICSEDRAWLVDLAFRYELIDDPSDVLSREILDELQMRVDMVPLSLALSQGAEESGWGTSRFADVGNAFFGEWAWGEGIKPKKQRSGKGDYRIKAFEEPLDSIGSYINNLNTHPAYADMRKKRAELRRQGKPVTGWILAETLTKYSERGPAYVESLKAIMRVNHLVEKDKAVLRDMKPVELVPVGWGAE